jgi:hypothetical protein
MNDLDAQLSERLHELAGGEPGSAAPTQRLLQRGRRARHRRAALAGTSLAVLAAGAVTAVAVATHSPTPAVTADRPPAATAATPRLELAAAVANSENISYRLKITAGGSKADPDGWGTAEGAYDPATSTGYLNSSQPDGPGVYYQRLINGKLYLGSNGSKTWKQEPSNGTFEYGDALGGAVGASADPQELFKALRQEGGKITQTGAGTYHFEVALKGDSAIKSGTLVGDVTVDADKRIAKVTYERTTQAEKDGQALTSTSVLTVELSDYGTPVQVEKPADVIVAK